MDMVHLDCPKTFSVGKKIECAAHDLTRRMDCIFLGRRECPAKKTGGGRGLREVMQNTSEGLTIRSKT